MLTTHSSRQETPRDTDGLLYTPIKEVTQDVYWEREASTKDSAEQIAWQQQLVDSLRETEENLRYDLHEIDAFWSSKQAKLKEELLKVQADLRVNQRELASAQQESSLADDARSSCVSGAVFNFICTGILVLNFVAVCIQAKFPQWGSATRRLDDAFLGWYIVELLLKAIAYRHRLLIGRCAKVFWNWLDLVIVIAGIADEMVMPLIFGLNHDDQGSFGASNLRVVRLLRFFRAFRVVRVCKFLATDLSWTEGPTFQSFIMGVVALNTVIMAAELDRPWDGWMHVEQALLCIYVFELAVRLKRWRWLFFVHPQDWSWNYLDLIIVAGGVVDEWLTPLTYFVQSQLGHPSHGNGEGNPLLKLIRFARLVRVLRLVRLLRAVKPLYKLLMGVLAAMQSIMWVMVLCLIILYAFAILTTHLLGRGILFGGHPEEVPDSIQNNFGSVLDSMFYLFKLMNDDQSVMNGAIHMIQAQILFVVFMVVSNWAVLAILTSVMSEGMLSATQSAKEAEYQEEHRKRKESSVERLITIFQELDLNEDQCIDEVEFQSLMEDDKMLKSLVDASGLRDYDLSQLFMHLSHEDDQGKSKIRYDEFVDKLQRQGVVVCQRSVFRVEKLLRTVESNLISRVEKKLDELMLRIGMPAFADMRHIGALVPLH